MLRCHSRYSELAAIALHNRNRMGISDELAGRAKKITGNNAELQDVLDRFDEDERRLPKRSFGFKAITVHAIESTKLTMRVAVHFRPIPISSRTAALVMKEERENDTYPSGGR